MLLHDDAMQIIAIVLEKRSVGISRYDRSPESILPVCGVVDLHVRDQIFSRGCNDGDRQTLNALRGEDVGTVPEALLVEMFAPLDDDVVEIGERAEVFDGREEVEFDERGVHLTTKIVTKY